MKILLLLALFLLSNTVYADSYTRFPSGSGVYGSVSINYTITSTDTLLALQACNSDWYINVYATTQSGSSVVSSIGTWPVSQTSITGTIIATSPLVEIAFLTAECSGSAWTVEGTDIGVKIFTLDSDTTNNIFGDGIFGNTSPLDLSASVAQGVRDTGVSIWPLFALVGVALAFVIAGLLVNFIRKSIISDRKLHLTVEKEIAKSDAKSWREQDKIAKEYDDKIKNL